MSRSHHAKAWGKGEEASTGATAVDPAQEQDRSVRTACRVVERAHGAQCLFFEDLHVKWRGEDEVHAGDGGQGAGQ